MIVVINSFYVIELLVLPYVKDFPFRIFLGIFVIFHFNSMYH